MSQRRTSRNQPHLPIPIHARYRRCDSQKLVHVEAAASYLPHTPQSRYVRTYLFLLLHNGNLFYPFQLLSIPFTRSDSDSEIASQNTLPYLPRIFKLSIHPVRELVAGCSDSRYKTHKRHPGGEVANNEGGLPYYPSWVISQRRRSWCCSMGRWASSYGGRLCLLFMDIMYTCR